MKGRGGEGGVLFTIWKFRPNLNKQVHSFHLILFPNMYNLNNAYCPCNADIKQDQSISQPNLKMLMLSENVCF